MQKFAWGRVALLAVAIFVAGPAPAAPPSVGPNVNMVSGTRFPEGDWNLTKQNEVSLAVSSRNPRHLMAGSNDYRLVLPDIAEGLRGAKAWVSLYKSVDGGTTWYTTIPGGCPLPIPQCNDATGLTAPVKALNPDFSADPTVRAGPYGTFFFSFIAGTRGNSTDGMVAIQRFVDKNDDIQRDFDVRTVGGQDVMKPAEDPILPDKLSIIDTGVKGQFVDKPWNAADVPGRAWNTGTCDLLSWTRSPPPGVSVRNVAETVSAFSVYVSFANFAGQGQNQHPNVYVAASNDCGTTFAKPVKVSNSLQASQGTQLAIDPLNGTVYVVWRVFADSSGPDAIYISKSSDGGKTWLNQPVRIATINSYDQDASGGAFRTLGFPTIAVSVQNGVSRVHVAWTQRKASPSNVPPYACPALDPADCDARIVMSTSGDGGLTWPAASAVDGAFRDPLDSAKPGRGHQLQPALTFASGKLLITWLDQRFDHTEEVLSCSAGADACTSRREAKGNLVPNCSVDVSGSAFSGLPQTYKDALAQCRAPYMAKASDAVWTTYLTDGTPGLVRRHTIDVFAAMASPGATPAFESGPVSRYVFGTTAQGTKDVYDIRQKQFNAPNLPMFVNGTAAFIGDYIDAAAAAITATGDPARPYKYDIGCGGTGNACGPFTTGGNSAVFHVGFTDNRDVIPPVDGDWTRRTCLTTEFTTDTSGAANGITNFGVSCNFAGAAGNRNQNVFSAIVAENSVAFANANSKRVGPRSAQDTNNLRGFVITVENLSDTGRTYTLAYQPLAPASEVTVSFDKETFPAQSPPPSVSVYVQPRSSSTRSLWVRSTVADDSRPITVSVTGSGFASQVVLNPDPNAVRVGNGDGTTTDDLANNDLGSVVLTNAVLTNNALTNAVLDDENLNANALSNNALTNAALSNVVLSNAVLSNLQVENLTPTSAALTNNALTNVVLSNVVLSNAVLSNTAIINAALSNAALSNAALSNVVLSNATLAEITTAVLSNNALSNVALTNVDPANVALSNAVLSNNALTNVVLSNNALSNAMLSNAALTNAALSNVVLSNAALSNAVLSNAVLSNNVLSNAVLSNAALTDIPDALSAVEQANFDLANNDFTPANLAASSFADASFTVRNRGNTDTTLAVKLLLRDADCTTGSCALPPGVTIQLVLRKIALTPAAIPPTSRALAPYDPYTNTSRALRIGLTQTNAQVSNVGTPTIVNPEDPDLGRFQPEKPEAATLPLSPGERAYVTLRAIGTNPDFDLVEFLRWGTKFVVVDASNNTRTRIPLIIKTLALPAVSAGQPASLGLKTFGGFGAISGTATCADSKGTTITTPCLPPVTVGTFAADGSTTLSFTPTAAGTYYLRIRVTDSSTPQQSDEQLLKVVVNLVVPVITGFPPTGANALPTSLTFGQTLPLPVLGTTAGAPTPYYSTTGPCYVDTTVVPNVLHTTGAGVCVIAANSDATTVYAAVTITAPPITIQKANQTITFAALPDVTVGGPVSAGPFTVTATASSGLAVSFTATGDCTLSGNQVTPLIPATSTGSCTVTAKQAGDANWNPAADVARTFAVNRAVLAITATSASKIYGDPLPTFGVTYNFDESTCGTRTGTLAFGTTATAASNVGSYAITPGGVSYSKCTVSFVPGFLTVTQATPVFSSLSAPVIAPGTATTPIGGKIGYGSVFPSAPQVSITLGGTTLNATPSAADGTFSASFSTGTFGVGSYPITFGYAGNTNFASASGSSVLIVEGFVSTPLMVQPRSWHTATRLRDGRVLVAGGFDASGGSTATSEVYCAVAAGNCATGDVGKFKAVGNLPSKSAGHTATLLENGTANPRVLVAGGGNSSSELFDPVSNTWVAGGGMSSTRSYHTATPIYDASGKVVTVLFVGGADNANKTLNSTVRYDVASGSFSAGPNLANARERHTAVTLADGRVLIAGGRVKSGSSYTAVAPAEIYNPATNTFATVASMGTGARYSHGAVRLADGRVLVAGGSGTSTDLATAQIYDPSANTWTTDPGTIGTARRELTLTPAPGDDFLIAGGQNGTTRVKTTTIYDPPSFAAGADMLSARAAHTATPLLDGSGKVVKVLVVGGIGTDGKSSNTAEIFQ
ncbi:MAG: kelch repeat-containing protein [Burkholderiales bacterium]